MNNNEILNKYINLIDKGYCSDCNELNCIDNFPHSKITHAIRELQQENKILRENAENNDKVVDKVNWENQKLKKQVEEANEKILLLQASEPMLEYKKVLEENQQKQFIEWLENEKDRLTRECSPTYKYSLGKTRFVNEDIFNEVDKILSKYKESCK